MPVVEEGCHVHKGGASCCPTLCAPLFLLLHRRLTDCNGTLAFGHSALPEASAFMFDNANIRGRYPPSNVSIARLASTQQCMSGMATHRGPILPPATSPTTALICTWVVIQKHILVHVTGTPELRNPIFALFAVSCDDVQRNESMFPVVVEYLHAKRRI